MREAENDEDFFEMVNIYPADSGLPMVVWASERGRARHDIRVKVNQSHGTRMLPGNLATVAVRPGQQIKAGDVLLTIEAMKMETALHALRDGTVCEVLAAPGQQVDAKDLLMIVE